MPYKRCPMNPSVYAEKRDYVISLLNHPPLRAAASTFFPTTQDKYVIKLIICSTETQNRPIGEIRGVLMHKVRPRFDSGTHIVPSDRPDTFLVYLQNPEKKR